jgi:monoamine oxidase
VARSLYAHLARRYRRIEPVPQRARETEEAVEQADKFYPLKLRDQPSLHATRRYHDEHVCVVGGGLAGLAAAWWLSSHGFRVSLFDARRRLGGRVRTQTSPEERRVIEHGAELIGRNHPAWIRFARLFGLPLTMITDSEMYDAMRLRTPLLVDGQRVQNVETIFDRLDDVLGKLNALAASVNPYRPWDAQAASTLDNMPVSEWVAAVTKRDKDVVFRRVLRFQFENMQGITLEDQSLLGLLAPVSVGLKRPGRPQKEPSAYWSESEVFRCGVGNEALVSEFVKRLAGHDVHTQSRVEHIAVGADGCDVTVAGASPRHFDWVVMAAPPQHWPAASDADIDPSWRVALGAAAKCLITVDRRCWLEDHLSPVGSATELGLAWEGTDNQNLPSGVPGELTLFLGATPATDASSAPSPEMFCLNGLQKMYPRLGNGSLSATFVNWPREEYITGGYSCPTRGSVCTRIRGMHDAGPRLVFAGEHVSMPWFGYMEGALQSGLRAAYSIAKSAGVGEAQALANLRDKDSRRQGRERRLTRSQQTSVLSRTFAPR